MIWKNPIALRSWISPPGLAARLSQLVLKVGDCLFVGCNRGCLVINLRLGVSQVLPGVLLPHRLVRVAVILLLLQVVIALQDVEFVRIGRQFLSSIGESLPPIVCTLFGGFVVMGWFFRLAWCFNLRVRCLLDLIPFIRLFV